MRDVMYVIIGFGFLCFVIKLFVSRMYRRLIRAAGQMGKSEHPLMKMLLKKFETCYQLKMGVENVEIFVDKYLNSYRAAGVHLYTWEVLGDVMFGITLLTSLLANLYIAVLDSDRRIMMEFLFVGIAICGIIILEDICLNLRFRRKRLLVEVRDYLENIYKPRLENQVFKHEEMEEYHREYFEEERAQLEELLSMKQEEEPPVKIEFTKEEEAVIVSVPLAGRMVWDRTAFKSVSDASRSALIKTDRVSSWMDLAEIWQAPGKNGLSGAKPLLIYKISRHFDLA